MKLFTIPLCFILFISCNKEDVQNDILIKYELTDDVSPVKVKFSVDGDYHWTEWMFDNRSGNGSNLEGEKGKSEWIFKNEGYGFGLVKFSGSDKNNVKYIGETNIPLPKVATQIEFTGLSAKDFSINFPDLNGTYKVEFTLYDPFPTVSKSVLLKLNNPEGGSINFNQSVKLDIPRFYDNAEHMVNISISVLDEPVPFFRKNLFLKEKYLIDRISFGKVQIGYNENLMFLEADWKP